MHEKISSYQTGISSSPLAPWSLPPSVFPLRSVCWKSAQTTVGSCNAPKCVCALLSAECKHQPTCQCEHISYTAIISIWMLVFVFSVSTSIVAFRHFYYVVTSVSCHGDWWSLHRQSPPYICICVEIEEKRSAKEERNTFPPLPFSHDSFLLMLPLPSQTINMNASDACGVTGVPWLTLTGSDLCCTLPENLPSPGPLHKQAHRANVFMNLDLNHYLVLLHPDTFVVHLLTL